jgi:hypothetical protein
VAAACRQRAISLVGHAAATRRPRRACCQRAISLVGGTTRHDTNPIDNPNSIGH